MDKITSTKPYLIRAIYEWCTETSQTPYIIVQVDKHTKVPHSYVQDDHITFDLGISAVSKLELGNALIKFYARFNGNAEFVSVPIRNIVAIYANETKEGLTFTTKSREIGKTRRFLSLDNSGDGEKNLKQPKLKMVK